MIAVMAISRDLVRRHYAKYRGLSRCVLEHDPSQLRPRSRFSTPLRAREAQRFIDEVQRNRKVSRAAVQLHTSAQHAAAVLQRLITVRDAATAILAGAKQGAGEDEAVVRMSALETLAALICQAEADAMDRLPALQVEP